jgi:hypothetical protein
MKAVFRAIIMGWFLVGGIAWAVDGFGELKWDATLQDVKKSAVCTFKDLGEDPDGVRTLGCADIPFGDRGRQAILLFVEEKLVRVGIIISPEEIGNLLHVLTEQYGPPSTGMLPKEGEYPSETLGWDKDTVLFRPIRQYPGQITNSVLLFTTSDYEKRVAERKRKVLQQSLPKPQS